MRKIMYFIILILLYFTAFPLNSQSLTIKGNLFYFHDNIISLNGVRVASASQNEDYTSELLKNLAEYKNYGVNSINVFLQGSSARFSDPFNRTGKKIDRNHLKRLKQIIEKCDELSMVVIVGIFYQRTMAIDSVRNVESESAVFNAVKTVTRELRSYDNIIFNIANEQNFGMYKRFEPYNLNDPDKVIELCKLVKMTDPSRIVGAGGYNDSLNIILGKSEYVDVLLFDTGHDDVHNNRNSGWHQDYFLKMGVPDKPMINVELFGGWTRQFVPPGVFTEKGKELYLEEIDEALRRPGLSVQLHVNPWIQGPSMGYPARFDLGGMGTEDDPGIRWWFEYLSKNLENKN